MLLADVDEDGINCVPISVESDWVGLHVSLQRLDVGGCAFEGLWEDGVCKGIEGCTHTGEFGGLVAPGEDGVLCMDAEQEVDD